MKFKDLPVMIDSGSYHISLPLKELRKWLTSEQVELCPDFQRGHVWNEKQQIAFVEWFLAGGITGRAFYFNGYAWRHSAGYDLVCVDGLQRITALLNFIENKIPAYGCLLNDFEDPLPTLRYLLMFTLMTSNPEKTF